MPIGLINEAHLIKLELVWFSNLIILDMVFGVWYQYSVVCAPGFTMEGLLTHT